MRPVEKSHSIVVNIAEAGTAGTDAKASVATAESSLAVIGVC